MEKTNHMKTSKFPHLLLLTKKYTGVPSTKDNLKTPVDEISASKKLYDSRIAVKQITNSRKFKIALFAAYSSLIAIFAIIVYAAIVLDPRFPF
jgi:hypothetical protein